MKVATAERYLFTIICWIYETFFVFWKCSCSINIWTIILNFRGGFKQQVEVCQRKWLHSNGTLSFRIELPDGKFLIFFVNGKRPLSRLDRKHDQKGLVTSQTNLKMATATLFAKLLILAVALGTCLLESHFVLVDGRWMILWAWNTLQSAKN